MNLRGNVASETFRGSAKIGGKPKINCRIKVIPAGQDHLPRILTGFPAGSWSRLVCQCYPCRVAGQVGRAEKVFVRIGSAGRGWFGWDAPPAQFSCDQSGSVRPATHCML
jgi:hypothetical protein